MHPRIEISTTAELRAQGLTRAALAAAVSTGTLIRARRGFYLPATAPADVVRAVRVGGRLTCLSLLALLGVFVQDVGTLHVHLPRTASRMRSPEDRRERLQRGPHRGARLHWLPLVDAIPTSFSCVGMIDALVHSVLCQSPRTAIATLDSALNRGLIGQSGLREVFRALPALYAPLLPLVDGRAESGPETLLRLMLRALGCSVELQVPIAGVGRVDLVVDGWLVIECDSKSFHSSWSQQEEDRRRDLFLAALGYTSLRPTASAIMYRPEEVLAAVKGLLAAHAVGRSA